ncbi:hypothetical protein LNV23_23815 [Paucibacter sp. DJ1R-11]|uniref:hypothetical protein n=1 Tax=Paucibacter sp. DJ1R-11 TaxID=2893556 RepID=UPI0021E410BF|nr:hypothetical protein [Paucibacter sp. DJ1R-11]MCV2366462.1 hypothetical protein [Paucibacter sp. DJ1R-11]
MQPDPVFEEFLQPATRARATTELAARGAEAIPVLRSLFSGEAKNAFGVPYIKLGTPLDCALVAAGRMGPLSKPLEPYIRDALSIGCNYAAHALASIGTLEEATISALATQLKNPLLISTDSAVTLAHCGQLNHPSVIEAVKSSLQAERAVAAALKFNVPTKS